MASNGYDADQIRVLRGLSPVRERPAMYIGDTGSYGVHHILFEVVDNSIDECLAGRCDTIDVVVHSDGSVSGTDNGCGIPVDMHPEEKRPGVEVVLTTLHAGSKFGGGGYKVSGGLHGVGVSCTNALSEWLEVRVRREGSEHLQRYERGVPKTKLQVVGKAKGTGTTIRFKPDPEIFEVTEFDYDVIARRLKELAYLAGGAAISLSDERTSKAETFLYRGGIAEYVKVLNRNKGVLHRTPVLIAAERDDVGVEVAIQYNDGYAESVLSFANFINTREGGTHVSGFRTALTRTVNQYGRKLGVLKEKDPNLSGDDVREGLCAVVSVKLLSPQFEGQTKAKLGNSEVEGIVNSVVGERLSEWFEEHPTEARRIIGQAQVAQRARDAARKASDLIKRKSALESGSMPGKLWDCSSRKREECEVFLVEGDSAAGSAKSARDARFQAILPLGGKPLTVEKARIDKVLGHEVLGTIISALGTGITAHSNGNGNGKAEAQEELEDELEGEADVEGEPQAEPTGDADEPDNGSMDLSKLRYERVIIMADADSDGLHIRTLLLTFFFRYMQPLITQGHVFIARPPLFRVKHGKSIDYAWSDEELKRLLDSTSSRQRTVSRFKGLGEMNAEDLALTTMDIATRRISKVTIDDCVMADDLFVTLLGEKVEPRREFISTHAKEVRNLDF